MPKKKAKKKTSETLKNNFGEFVHENALKSKFEEQKKEVEKTLDDKLTEAKQEIDTNTDVKIAEVEKVIPIFDNNDGNNEAYPQYKKDRNEGIEVIHSDTIKSDYKFMAISGPQRYQFLDSDEIEAIHAPYDNADYLIVDRADKHGNHQVGKVVPIYNFKFSDLQALLSNEDLGAKEVKIPAFKIGQTPINEKYTDVTLSVKKKGAPLAQEQNYKFVVKKEALKGVKNPVIDLTSLIKPASELEK